METWIQVMKDTGHFFLPLGTGALNNWCVFCGAEFSYEQARDGRITKCDKESKALTEWQRRIGALMADRHWCDIFDRMEAAKGAAA